jgi:DNA primase
MSETVTLVKSRLGIAEVVGSYIKLEKAGANFRARCPFHNERTPSFIVSPTRNSYYCFGCNRGGDIFSFVQEVEGVEFFESLKILAARAGVQITFENPGARDERARLLAVIAAASNFYEDELSKNPTVSKYLLDRGLTSETIKTFHIGFAPADWRKTEEFLLAKGFQRTDIQKAGLSIDGTKKDGTKITYDRFRGRIMFPLSDSGGNIVAFSGRIFGSSEEGTAKYINSPETPLYSKSDLLYGYFQAKSAIREKGFAIVVEGQMDLILSHQAGFTNTVAVSGTALTERHLALISRMADTVYFSFDADSAGEKALIRSAGVALPLGMTVKAIPIEGGKDPADLVLTGVDVWKKAVESAVPIIEYALGLCEKRSSNEKGEIDRARFGKLVNEIVLPLVARIENKIEEGRFVEIIAGRLHVPANNVLEELKKIAKGVHNAQIQNTPTYSTDRITESRETILQRELLGIYFWQKDVDKPRIPLDELTEQLETFYGKENLKEILEKSGESDILRLSMQAELWYKDNTDLGAIVEELFISLQTEQAKTALINTIDRLRRAEEKGDEALIQKELALCRELSEKLSHMKKK